MRKIVFFSGNLGKIKEVKNRFNNSYINILSLNDFSRYKEPNETGKTFEENAKIKSLYGFSKFKLPCFADDSGICIEALENKPGINSKRFLESFKNRDKCFSHIIKKAKQTNNFNAYFKSIICLTINKDEFFYFDGIINGKISEKISGLKGFGYDPIFIPDGYTKTFAQMRTELKNKISHRGKALDKLINYFLK